MLNFLTAEEAAELIQNGDVLGMGGFTATGVPKAVPFALAQRAERLHAEGIPFRVGLETGASMGDSCDGALARAHAVEFRTPYQSNKSMREEINAEGTHYFDMHLSHMAQDLRYGFLPRPKFAIIEASYVGEDGTIVPAAGVGIMPTICRMADKIIVELNEMFPATMRGMHDLYEPLDPPARREIPIYHVSDRAGTPTAHVDPKKVLGVVKCSAPIGKESAFTPVDEVTRKIGENVCDFLVNEMKQGRIPKSFLPIQSGVGNIANAVLDALENSHEIPPFEMYTEVVQDSVLKLLESGHCKFASTCSLTFSGSAMAEFFSKPELHDKVVMRPCEISNNPEVIRRIGVISMNTAIEADIYGNINSSHVSGTRLMNGIGGSGDFTRNAYTSIFLCPSIKKDDCISTIVPMVTHVDHTVHSVDVIVTDQGVADLRFKDPIQCTEEIIEHVAHPVYRPLLREYLKVSKGGHILQDPDIALAFHSALAKDGDMRKADFSKK